MAKTEIKYTPDQIAYSKELLDTVRVPPMQKPLKNRPLTMRGVDFYGERFPRVLLENLRRFYDHYLRFPVHPHDCETLNEKLFWSKFYTPWPLPTPANKLSVSRYIPDHLRDKVRAAKIHWISDQPNFPQNVKGAEGHYFLKANNSWRSSRRIRFPIARAEMKELRQLGADWMARTNFSIWGGEWWYSTIEPRLYIEEDISDDAKPCPEYKIQCVHGEVVCVFREHFAARSEQKKYEGVGIFDHNFQWVEGVEIGELENIRTEPPADARLMLDVAREIAKPFDAIRIDLYNPSPNSIILGELTLCDAGGFAEFEPRSFDCEVGSSWDFQKYFL